MSSGILMSDGLPETAAMNEQASYKAP